MKLPIRYLPLSLTKKDKTKYKKEILKSKKLYKQNNYYTRKKIKSFKSKKSNHILNAQRMYKVDKIDATNNLAKATKCSIGSLKEIIRKGEGAYYSSGSRPNQTAQSWGKARLASAITGGKAAAIDYNILEKGCKKNSRALRLAIKAKKRGTRKAPKVFLDI
jgi:hypothetical protein